MNFTICMAKGLTSLRSDCTLSATPELYTVGTDTSFEWDLNKPGLNYAAFLEVNASAVFVSSLNGEGEHWCSDIRARFDKDFDIRVTEKRLHERITGFLAAKV